MITSRRVSYWKLAANAAWAGLYATTILAALVLVLNGAQEETPASVDLAAAIFSLAPVYVPGVALVLTTLLVFVRFFAVRRLSARWQSLKAIVWFVAAALAGMTLLTWLNLRILGGLLSPRARDGLRLAVGVMAAAFVLGCALASLAQGRSGTAARRLRIAAAAILLTPVLVLVMIALALPPRPPSRAVEPGSVSAGSAAAWLGPDTEERNLILVGVDAASMDHILPLVASGDLPAFDRIIRKGASSRLNTLRPCSSPAAWAALLTGRAPWESGIRTIDLHDLALGPAGLDLLPRGAGMAWLRQAGYVSTSRRPSSLWDDRAIWDVARRAGLHVESGAWSDTLTLAPDDPRVRSRAARIVGDEGAGPAGAERLAPLMTAVAADLAVRDAALAARASHPHLLALRLRGLAEVARRYLRDHAPEQFGEVADPAQEGTRRILTGYYEFLDEVLGELLDDGGERAFVLLLSAHGIEPIPPWERAAARIGLDRSDDPEISGSWRSGPDGVLLLQGPGVAPGARLEEVDLLEVAPAAIYLMGLPVQRAMRGNLLRRGMRPEFLEAHPVHVVPSWDSPL